MASQPLRTGNEGVVPIIVDVRAAVERGQLRIEWAGVCLCEWCFNGQRVTANWPVYYVGSVGLSYECYLERNAFYTSRGRYREHGASRTTSSPSAAAIADMEVRGVMLAVQETHLSDKHERAEARAKRRAYRQAFKEGWRFIEGQWVQCGEILTA